MRLIFALLLLTLAAPAWAEWVWCCDSGHLGLKYYYDPATIKKRNDVVRVWTLQDRKEQSKSGAMSIRALAEYDCKEERYRFLGGTTHSGQMASGDILQSDNKGTDWAPTKPGSIVETMLIILCK